MLIHLGQPKASDADDHENSIWGLLKEMDVVMRLKYMRLHEVEQVATLAHSILEKYIPE